MKKLSVTVTKLGTADEKVAPTQSMPLPSDAKQVARFVFGMCACMVSSSLFFLNCVKLFVRLLTSESNSFEAAQQAFHKLKFLLLLFLY